MSHRSMTRKFSAILRKLLGVEVYAKNESSSTDIWKINIYGAWVFFRIFLSILITKQLVYHKQLVILPVIGLPNGDLISTYHFLFLPVGNDFFVGLAC